MSYSFLSTPPVGDANFPANRENLSAETAGASRVGSRQVAGPHFLAG